MLEAGHIGKLYILEDSLDDASYENRYVVCCSSTHCHIYVAVLTLAI